MKLATPLRTGTHSKEIVLDAENSIIAEAYGLAAADAIVATVNDHARLTADLADAVAALKDIQQEARIIIDAEEYPETGTPRNIDIDCANIILKRCRALVARVEART